MFQPDQIFRRRRQLAVLITVLISVFVAEIVRRVLSANFNGIDVVLCLLTLATLYVAAQILKA